MASEISFTMVFLVIAIILASAKIGGEIAKKLGQPAVLGEIFVGIILGPSFMGLINLEAKTSLLTAIVPIKLGELEFTINALIFLAEVGLIVLLFQVGIENDYRVLKRTGWTAVSAAVSGVLFPFFFGALTFLVFDIFFPNYDPALSSSPEKIAIFIGATMVATSIGISVRVLADLDKIHTQVARIMLGAAVIDDVLGLMMLSMATSLVTGELSLLKIVTFLVAAISFFVLTIAFGRVFLPPLFRYLESRYRHLVFPVLFSILLLLAALANLVGLAGIIGAFLAGVLAAEFSNIKDEVEEQITPLSSIFVPFFFVSIGLQVQLQEFFNLSTLILAIFLTITAILTKLGGTFIAAKIRGFSTHDSYRIGVAMIPRGEVGFIFSSIGLSLGVFGFGTYGALIVMCIATTIVVPPWLKRLFKKELYRIGEVDVTT